MLKKIVFGLMAAAVLMTPVSLAQGGLTEPEVRQFLARGDAAANSMNVEQMLGMLAPDVKIQITMQGQSTPVDREQYAQMLTQSHAMLQGYQHRSEIQSIRITGDKAVVQSTAYETADLGEHGTYTGVTHEVSEIEKRGGKLVVTSVNSSPSLK